MRLEIDLIRKEYKKQKRIEEFVLTRTLSRPKTKKWHVYAFFVLYFILLTTSIVYVFFIGISIPCKLLLLICTVLFINEFYLRFCLIEAIKCYQHYASDEIRRTCKCVPSCSEYALLSLKTFFPLLLALLKIKKRLYVTCNGEEYKVDFPNKKSAKSFNEIQ